ncbi:hypothetical protein CF326_g4631 [Tilletia indica]|nr:hypothetical protein CF326_g4631 [Tilletia indica]
MIGKRTACEFFDDSDSDDDPLGFRASSFHRSGATSSSSPVSSPGPPIRINPRVIAHTKRVWQLTLRQYYQTTPININEQPQSPSPLSKRHKTLSGAPSAAGPSPPSPGVPPSTFFNIPQPSTFFRLPPPTGLAETQASHNVTSPDLVPDTAGSSHPAPLAIAITSDSLLSTPTLSPSSPPAPRYSSSESPSFGSSSLGDPPISFPSLPTLDSLPADIRAARAAACDRRSRIAYGSEAEVAHISGAIHRTHSIHALNYFDVESAKLDPNTGEPKSFLWRCRCCRSLYSAPKGATSNLTTHLHSCPHRSAPLAHGLPPWHGSRQPRTKKRSSSPLVPFKPAELSSPPHSHPPSPVGNTPPPTLISKLPSGTPSPITTTVRPYATASGSSVASHSDGVAVDVQPPSTTSSSTRNRVASIRQVLGSGLPFTARGIELGWQELQSVRDELLEPLVRNLRASDSKFTIIFSFFADASGQDRIMCAHAAWIDRRHRPRSACFILKRMVHGDQSGLTAVLDISWFLQRHNIRNKWSGSFVSPPTRLNVYTFVILQSFVRRHFPMGQSIRFVPCLRYCLDQALGVIPPPSTQSPAPRDIRTDSWHAQKTTALAALPFPALGEGFVPRDEGTEFDLSVPSTSEFHHYLGTIHANLKGGLYSIADAMFVLDILVKATCTSEANAASPASSTSSSSAPPPAALGRLTSLRLSIAKNPFVILAGLLRPGWLTSECHPTTRAQTLLCSAVMADLAKGHRAVTAPSLSSSCALPTPRPAPTRVLGAVNSDLPGKQASQLVQDRISCYVRERSRLPLSYRTTSTTDLVWWKANSARYPALSRLARTVLATPLTAQLVDRTYACYLDSAQVYAEVSDLWTLVHCRLLIASSPSDDLLSAPTQGFDLATPAGLPSCS